MPTRRQLRLCFALVLGPLMACGARSGMADLQSSEPTTVDAAADVAADDAAPPDSPDAAPEDAADADDADTTPAISDAPARLLAILTGDESAVVMRVAPDGVGEPRTLDFSGTMAWSFDGRHLAFGDNWSGGPTWIAEARDDGLAESVKVADTTQSLSWSPTHPWLLIALDQKRQHWRLVDVSTPAWTTRDFDLPGALIQSIVSFEQPWSPDGTKALIMADQPALYRVGYVFDALDPSSSPIPLDDFTQLGLDFTCTWSRDGRWIASKTKSLQTYRSSVLAWDLSAAPFERVDLTGDGPGKDASRVEFAAADWLLIAPYDYSELFAVHVDGHDLPPHVPLEPELVAYSYLSPDGRQLQHACHGQDNAQAVCVSAFHDDGIKGPTLVWDGRADEPRWSPDGRALTLSTHDPNLTDLQRLRLVEVSDASLGAITLLAEGNAYWPWRASWSPDSSWIVYEDPETAWDQRVLLARDLQSGTVTELFEPGQYDVAWPWWASDSRAVVALHCDWTIEQCVASVRFLNGRTFDAPVTKTFQGRSAYAFWQPVLP